MMSDRVEQSDHVSHGTARKSMHPSQSSWMAHWKYKACEPAETQTRNLLSHQCELKEDDGDTKQYPLLSRPEMTPAISKFAVEFGEVSEARTVNIMNESLKKSLKKFSEERLDSQPFAINFSRNKESTLALKDDQATICHGGVMRSKIDPNFTLDKSESHLPSMLVRAHPETESPSRECQFRPTGISWNPEQQVKSHKFLEKKGVAVSTSFQDYVGSSSKIVPYGCNSGRTPMQSFMCRQEENDQSSPIAATKELFPNTNYHSYSACLVHEKKTENELNLGRSGTPLLRQNDVPLLLHGPSASNDQLPAFAGKQCQTIQDNSGIRLFPSWNTPPEAIKSEKLYHDCYSIPRLPYSVQDVETMRICTNVDSVKELSGGGPPEFHQATHQFLITNKTGFNLSEGGQMFRESSVSTKFKGKMFGELLSLSPSFSFHGQHGAKLQSLGSSTDSEGKENVKDVKTSAICIKNESSAETDTMEMDDIQKNHLSGVALSPSAENMTGGQNSATSQVPLASAREEIGGGLPNTEIPDINQELPALPAVASSVDDKETSTSRTQSLDVDRLLSHAEHPTNSKSSACPDGPVGTEPSSRWVKRLKLSSSDSFVHGTKSSKMGEASSHGKVNKLFSKIFKCSITSSEPPTVGRRQGKEQMALDQTAVLLKNSESSSTDTVRKGQDITLSHAWIQRWCRNRAASPQKKPEAVVVCEPQSSKATFDDLQKKQYPSIAAMALMGKAMSGFCPCEFKKRGSFVVWSTKGI